MHLDWTMTVWTAAQVRLVALQGAEPSAPSSQPAGEVLLWVGVLSGLLLVGALGIMWYRRRVLADDDASADDEGLLQRLARLRDEGRMSQAEYDAARRSLIQRVKARMDQQQADRQDQARASAPARRAPSAVGEQRGSGERPHPRGSGSPPQPPSPPPGA